MNQKLIILAIIAIALYFLLKPKAGSMAQGTKSSSLGSAVQSASNPIANRMSSVSTSSGAAPVIIVSGQNPGAQPTTYFKGNLPSTIG